MVSPRIREVQDQGEMQRVIDDFMTQGYTIKEQGSETTLLKQKSWGSAIGIIVSIILMIIVGVVTVFIGFLFSWLIPVIYVIYAHYNAPEVLIRVRARPQAPPQQAAPQAAPRVQPPPPQGQTLRMQTNTVGKICASCSTLNDSNSVYCSRCGARM